MLSDEEDETCVVFKGGMKGALKRARLSVANDENAEANTDAARATRQKTPSKAATPKKHTPKKTPSRRCSPRRRPSRTTTSNARGPVQPQVLPRCSRISFARPAPSSADCCTGGSWCP